MEPATYARSLTHADPTTAPPTLAANDDAVAAQLTLARLVERLGSGVLDVLVAPSGLDGRVGHAAIHDPTEPARTEQHDVVLAVAVRPDDPTACQLVLQAGEAGATAVVMKTRDGVPADLLEAAEAAGVAILAAPPEITWSQLHALMRTAIASSDHASEGGAGRAPLGDLFALANAVSAMVGGPATIEDPKSRVLAYSSFDDVIDEPRRRTILGRRVPDDWLEVLNAQGVFRQLWSTRDVVHVGDLSGDGSLRPRMAIAVRAGDEIIGSIWVAEGKAPFDAASEDALRHAAEIAALHIVRNRTSDDMDRRIRGEQLRNIIEGRGALDVVASRLGIRADSAFIVVAFELQTAQDAEVLLQRERALDLVALYCEAYRRKAVSVPIGHTIYTLVPLTDAATLDGVRRLVTEILERSQQVLSVRLRVAMGSVVPHLRDVVRSRAEADQVLRVLARAAGRSMASIDDVRAPVLLLELSDIAKDRPHLLVGDVDRLVEHDATHGSEYVQTLTAYFDAFGDVPVAAAAISVHPNTFRYRLRRLCEVAHLDLTDRDQRLAAELQLRLR